MFLMKAMQFVTEGQIILFLFFYHNKYAALIQTHTIGP